MLSKVLQWGYPQSYMKNKSIASLIGVVLFFTASASMADSFNEKCPDIPVCAKVVGELLGQKYIYDMETMKGKIQATPNLELTKENAEVIFTDMLNLAGYSRVPLSEPNTFQISRQRDARDLSIPLFKGDQKHTPELPNTWDLVTLEYKATNAEVVEQIARTARSFMPANSRIIPSDINGTLLVTDTGPNLKKLYEIIKDLDQKPSAEMKKRWAEAEKTRHLEMMQRKHDEASSPPPASVAPVQVKNTN